MPAGRPYVRFSIADHDSTSEAFGLFIGPEAVSVEAKGPAGFFHALNSLAEIAARCCDRWPCQRVNDAPDLSVRGLSLDVSRGRVPTLEALFELVDRLAVWRINHLQLYVEHTFDFSFDPAIADGCSPLTTRDIASLDAYCRERFIELVPSLSTFGHMGRILSLPQYRHLAEIEATTPWEAQSWLERTRGLTLDARNPESRRLLERMLDESRWR